MKRALKWAGWLVVAPFLLCLLLALLLYIPPVQDFAVRQASAYVSRQTGYDIQFSRLRISFPLDIDLQDLVVLDAEHDTLVAAGSALVNLDLSRIMRMQLGVDAIRLAQVKADTKQLIPTARIRGRLDSFTLRADSLDLRQQRALLNDALLSGADLDIALRDTIVPDDTASTPLHWRIDVEKIAVDRSRIRFAMPGDSMLVAAGIGSLTAQDGHIDLGTNQFRVGRAALQADSVLYSLPFDSVASPIDYNHLAMDSVAVAAHDIVLHTDPFHLNLQLDDARAHERNSQLTLDGASGEADITDEHLSVKSLILHTPTSSIKGDFDLDFDALTPEGNGEMSLTMQTDMSKADLMKVAGPMLPEALAKNWPDVPMRARLTANGPLNSLSVTQAELTMPGSFTADLKGQLGNLKDGALEADADFNIETRNIDWLKPVADGALDGVRLPPMSATGHARMQGSHYDVQTQVHEGRGRMDVKASVDNGSVLTYDVDAALRGVNVRHFLPNDSIGLVSARIKAKGSGTDLLAPATRLKASGDISQLQYGHWDLSGIGFDGNIANGYGTLTANSDNKLLAGTVTAGAKLGKKLNDVTFSADVLKADLHELGLSEEPLSVSMCMHADGTTNLTDRHSIRSHIDDIYLQTADSLYHPTDIDLDALLMPDSVHIDMRSGDLTLVADGSTGIERLIDQLDHCRKEVERQLAERRIDQNAIMARMPQIDMNIRAGKENTVAHILRSMGYSFNDMKLDLSLDPHTGVNGGGHIFGLNTGSILLDSVTMHAYQDSTGMKLDTRIHNNKRNPQIAFDARMNAYVLPTGAGATLTYLDDRGRKGVDLGLEATIEDEGYRLHLEPLNPLVAYRQFKLNADNYVLIGRNKKVEAKVDMLADDGTALQFYSTPNDDALQDLTLELQRVNLGELMSVLPYMPRLTGQLEGDLHLVQTADNMSVAADMNVADMTYEGASLGQVGLQAVYMPNADGTQFVDGSLLQTGVPVANFTGSYRPQDEGPGLLDIDASLERLPLSMANGFLPSGLARMEGALTGDLHVGGTTERPKVDGTLATLDMHLISDPYSLNFRFPNDSIEISQSVLKLNRLEAYTTGRNPMVLDGTCDFSNLDKIRLNLTANATDFELINAKPNRSALAYGKADVDVNARINGTLDNLNVYGNMRVLGSSDLTYVLADSPLTVEDQLADLVTFVDFTDTVTVAEPREHPQHLNAMLNLNIDDAAQLHCLLSADRSSYVDLEGGGNLMLTYSPEKDLEMKGRYTINSGKLKYTMMVIPLKEFSVAPGSYVEWRGPVSNPTLSLSATERLKTTVTENSQPRSVNFDVGLNVSQTLENMGLEFTLEAPEDMSIQNELASMSTEQRGRVAVTMLATGMYITDSGSMSSGGFSTQNALNAFLQSQISGLAGKALQSVDLSMGVENSTTATGGTTTDYSFRFAKRFWGNRISVIVGGKVSTGDEAKNTGETLIDNVSLEYRLDKSATRYVNLFYDKNRESLLDGEIVEMGAGLVLRRKTDRLGELFLFKKKKD